MPHPEARDSRALPIVTQKDRAPEVGSPRISVVLPTYREGARLRAILDRLSEQTWPLEDMEILVADSQSGDETEAVCCAYMAPFSVHFLSVPFRGRAQGLNYAIKRARGEFVVRVDGRSIVPRDYVQRLVQTALQTGAFAVGGVQVAEPAVDAGVWERAVAVSMNSICGAGPANHRRGVRSGPNDNIYLGVYRKALFDAIGYFDEESPVISEEVDLHYRAIRAGYVVWLDSTLAIPYRPRGNLLGQLQLYFRYGGAKSAFITKYRTLITLRQLIAPGFYLALLALLVSALLWPSLWGLFGLALGAYVAALLSCGLLECGRRRQIQLAPLVAVVSAAMHVGYAAGYFRRLLIRDVPGTYWGS